MNSLKKWNRRLERAIHTLRKLVHYDTLYIGGGNARKIGVQLDGDTTVVSNKLGVKGGVALWLGARWYRKNADRGRSNSARTA